MKNEKIYDIAIIGAGINGAAIARDAAGRNLSVCLIEKNMPGKATSSASTKLIHGGLRYLEHYDFAMVRESLQEREILFKAAPFLNKPLQFILPYTKKSKPYWFLRLGLFLYDLLAFPTKLPMSKSISFKNEPFQNILNPLYQKGFIYSDLWTNDYELVMLNIQDAKNKGADLFTQTDFIKAQREKENWHIYCHCKKKNIIFKAKALINAAGPWVDDVQVKIEADASSNQKKHHLRLIKGSHIIIKKLFDHDFAYTIPHDDGRVIFAIPYQKKYTLIGTTEIECKSPAQTPHITPDETSYLINAINTHFTKQISEKDIVSSYAGIRPLYEQITPGPKKQKATSLSRDFHLILNTGKKLTEPPLVTIYGGKLTTHRRLAEKTMALLGYAKKSWTQKARFYIQEQGNT